MTAEIRTPRPAPQYFLQPQTFSTKKARNGDTPRDTMLPKPPVKSAPPISRIFPHRPSIRKAQPISFKPHKNCILSPHYNTAIKDLFFDQCFEIVCKLGVGSFGEVFKVRSKEDGRYYAVKRSRERFRGECDRRRKLEEVAKHEELPRHPNCVGFVKAWEEKQHLYIQTELCHTSLCNFAEHNHNIPEQIIWNYLVDLLMAVKHLHDHDLVHMDIKPENIFISDDGICKLGDFGLVLDLRKGVDLSEAQEGDPKYLAPELMAGKFGKPADVFSLGITILELASDLDLPRGGDLWHQLRCGTLPEEFLLGISGDLKEVLKKMLESEPSRRATVDEILNMSCVTLVWKRRKREQVTRSVVSSGKCFIRGLLSLLFTLWLTITYPLQSLLPQHLQHTPTKDSLMSHPPEWDHSFSDDDLFDDEGISLHNTSLGAPLDFSSSSDDSARDHDGFLIPHVPAQKACTTPGLRYHPTHHPPRTYFSNSSGSPVLSCHDNIFSSSPMASRSSRRDYEPNDSITPNTSFHQADEDMAEAAKLGIEPKNLMGVIMRQTFLM
ncbi:hypothetical protein NP493_192g03061 [Ridgeia piscesae]|uniref:Membrane-associated tyrosine- and threonine-specific cdc2-inhibitory kinase n=1 Tax=Ridgeia piscesae TaxID=27915 RepID=A0AAD9P250_RIDPI|nr:hypothetical protein NP493_192g03061 [Ridgeia piscesae]